MAVYTEITADDLESLLAGLGIGRLKTFSGVADGLENSTYFVITESPQLVATESPQLVTTESPQLVATESPQLVATESPRSRSANHEWVLTILELDNPQQTEFSVALMEYLLSEGLPVAPLVKDRQGNAVHIVAGKDALLARKMKGLHPGQAGASAGEISTAQCSAIGEFLGRMHRLSAAFPKQHTNPYGLTWATSTAETLAEYLTHKEQGLISEQLARQQSLRKHHTDMPRGAIHGDLFSDNALFDGDKLNAVIDFQSACVDCLLLDVAIAINDWASLEAGEIDLKRAEALLVAYAKQRPFVPLERECWQGVLCFAALQFWLSRQLVQFRLGLPGGHCELTGRPSKDPEQYARILRSRMAGVTPLSW